MNSPTESNEALLRRVSLEFFGAITASISHELNNVLSIIDQFNGIISDQVHMDAPANKEKLSVTGGKIEKQVERGIGILRAMNRFAHLADQPVARFTAESLAEHFVDLMRRPAGLRRFQLTYSPSDNETMITGDPFSIELLLFACLRHLLAADNDGGTIEVSAREQSDTVEFVFLAHPIDAPVDNMTIALLSDRNDGTVIWRNGFIVRIKTR